MTESKPFHLQTLTRARMSKFDYIKAKAPKRKKTKKTHQVQCHHFGRFSSFNLCGQHILQWVMCIKKKVLYAKKETAEKKRKFFNLKTLH